MRRHLARFGLPITLVVVAGWVATALAQTPSPTPSPSPTATPSPSATPPATADSCTIHPKPPALVKSRRGVKLTTATVRCTQPNAALLDFTLLWRIHGHVRALGGEGAFHRYAANRTYTSGLSRGNADPDICTRAVDSSGREVQRAYTGGQLAVRVRLHTSTVVAGRGTSRWIRNPCPVPPITVRIH